MNKERERRKKEEQEAAERRLGQGDNASMSLLVISLELSLSAFDLSLCLVWKCGVRFLLFPYSGHCLCRRSNGTTACRANAACGGHPEDVLTEPI